MSTRPQCREQHALGDHQPIRKLDWQPADVTGFHQIFTSCTNPHCDEPLHQFGFLDNRPVITRTNRVTGQIDMFAPDDRGDVLPTWLQLTGGTAI